MRVRFPWLVYFMCILSYASRCGMFLPMWVEFFQLTCLSTFCLILLWWVSYFVFTHQLFGSLVCFSRWPSCIDLLGHLCIFLKCPFNNQCHFKNNLMRHLSSSWEEWSLSPPYKSPLSIGIEAYSFIWASCPLGMLAQQHLSLLASHSSTSVLVGIYFPSYTNFS